MKKQSFTLLIFSLFSLFGSANKKRRLKLENYNKIFVMIDKHDFDKASKKIRSLPENNCKELAIKSFKGTYENSLLGEYEELVSEIQKLGPISKDTLKSYETFLEIAQEIEDTSKPINFDEFYIKEKTLPRLQKEFEAVINLYKTTRKRRKK